MNLCSAIIRVVQHAFDIPNGAIHLASSRHCINQAFRYGDNVYAFQFHLEVDEPMIRRWLKVPENRREIANLHGDIDPDQIHVQTSRHIGRLHELSDRVFGEFIELFGLDRNRPRLMSRYTRFQQEDATEVNEPTKHRNRFERPDVVMNGI